MEVVSKHFWVSAVIRIIYGFNFIRFQKTHLFQY